MMSGESAWRDCEGCYQVNERRDFGGLLCVTAWVDGPIQGKGFRWIVGTETDGEPNEPLLQGEHPMRTEARSEAIEGVKSLLRLAVKDSGGEAIWLDDPILPGITGRSVVEVVERVWKANGGS